MRCSTAVSVAMVDDESGALRLTGKRRNGRIEKIPARDKKLFIQ